MVCLVAAMATAWWILSLINFAYPVWYEVLDIEQTVAEHAPRNNYRPGFEATTPDDHRRLFGEILTAVNRGGDGLASITYIPAGQSSSRALLRPAEVTHLRDVAGLVTLLHWAGGVSLVMLPVIALVGRRLSFQPAPLRRILAGVGIFTACVAVVVTIIGPVTVFYAAHEWIFPSDHQWFFYYNESLMTMLMQAPNLFLPTGLSWLALSLSLFAAGWFAILRVLR